MALQSFRVENQKALRLAECQQVPRIMIIAGPNGVGKSTLLHNLHRKVGAVYGEGTQVLYQPPHRAIRRQKVRRRFLSGALKGFAEIFSGLQISGFEGLSIPFPERSPDNVDEAGSTIKYTLGKIENRRLTVLGSLVDKHRMVGKPLETAAMPNIYEPLEKLTSRLLPHLAFERMDFSNEDDIHCIFRRTDVVSTADLDLDDLSSGEKSIILLFLPLIAKEIDRLFDVLSPPGDVRAEAQSDRVFLIDEPEQHLHPDLQNRILGYLREEVASKNIQFVLTTHSSALVDQAFDNELYTLTFPKGRSENQLRKVATSVDRLEALKALTGSTYVVTTGRSIICLEGRRDAHSKPTDVRLLEILFPRATQYTFVPVGGKGNVITVVRELRKNLPEEHFGLRIFGIVDKDRAENVIEGVASWPVCSIENLLLNAKAIIQCLQELVGETEITVEQVESHIRDAAAEQREEEIELRVMEAIGATTIRIKGTSLAEVKAALTEQTGRLHKGDAELEAIVTQATESVDRALQDRTFARVFRGKELLRSLYKKIELDRRNISYERFTYSLASVCSKDGEIQDLLNQVFAGLEEQRAGESNPLDSTAPAPRPTSKP